MDKLYFFNDMPLDEKTINHRFGYQNRTKNGERPNQGMTGIFVTVCGTKRFGNDVGNPRDSVKYQWQKEHHHKKPHYYTSGDALVWRLRQICCE